MHVVDDHLLILASAGSGKTYQLGNRVIGKVARGVEPEKIVALTFTRKAAGEFADSVLGKLATAALDPKKAKELSEVLACPDADFARVLERVVRAMPNFTLTTIDSFFVRVVRGFQYELGLTGGRFELLEGARAAAERDHLIGELLRNPDEDRLTGHFLSAFRRATHGKERVSVYGSLRGFVDQWHRIYCRRHGREWTPEYLLTADPADWEANKASLASVAHDACAGIMETRKGQIEAVRKFIDRVQSHTTAGGGFPADGKLAEGILEAVAASHTGDLELNYHKPFVLHGLAFEGIKNLVRLAAEAELGAAILRTRAIEQVISGYDALVENQLRRCGRLGFDDVKRLMGKWQHSEEDRITRELIDFRLDARFEHWLLDEFQDTSREEWNGLLPLLMEACQGGDDGSLFIVGDRKQAIYGWRGGDVSLFDEVIKTFGGGMRQCAMAESWRSCPEVLSLVNQVCGASSLIHQMFGIPPERWIWDTHVTAPALKQAGFSGEACVELFELAGRGISDGDDEEEEDHGAKRDPRIQRMIERMHELGIGRKPLECGVLVRRNQDGREIAEILRSEGFDVVLDGIREPAKDHPAGVVAWQWLCWLANPMDHFARGCLELSPLIHMLKPDDEASWYGIWEEMHDQVIAHGYARTLANLFRPLMDSISAYGRRRIGEIVDAMSAFDQLGDASAHAAADWLKRLEVPQNSGTAAVQVMTIHKSKGLGFDVVFLPSVPDVVIPERQRFNVAFGDGWLTEAPAAWARQMFPELRRAEAGWAADQAYEALCQLYVGLTRAKRGLYVYLGKRAKSLNAASPSLTQWMMRALADDVDFGTLYHMGDPDWTATIKEKCEDGSPPAEITLGDAVVVQRRSSPSAAKAHPHPNAGAPVTSSRRQAMDFGTSVHRAFESIGWLDAFDPAVLPQNDVGNLLRRVLAHPAVSHVFERPAGRVDLFREQPIDGWLDGVFFSGVIDRMHVHREADDHGRVVHVDIIDFKTDAIASISDLMDLYREPMDVYRGLVAKLYPQATIGLMLLSTHLETVVSLD